MLHLLWGVLLAATRLPRLHGDRRRELVRSWSGEILHILDIELVTSGQVPAGRALMLVGNHISWLDIWAVNAAYPVRFVSKAEVRDWPVIGWLAVRVGVIFIERSRRHDTHRVSGLAAKALLEGDSLCMFPEGTTSDGARVLPFRTSLLQAPIDAGAGVLPVAIHYPALEGGLNTAVAYHGDISLWQSLRSILAQRQLKVELDFLPVIETAGLDRRALTQQCHSAISGRLHPAGLAAPGTGGGLPA